ncbi:hypothetical protein ACPCG0_09680 [Propionibacteriaceae bacterium Y1923]
MMTDFYPGLRTLHTLAATLKGYGITLPLADELEATSAKLNRLRDLEPDPIDPVTATPDELARHITQAATARAATGQVHNVVVELERVAYEDLRERIAARADEVLDQMRPHFDTAAQAARDVIALGVPADATAETFLELGTDQRDAWKTFKATHTKTLDKALRVRQMLSGALQLPPMAMEGPWRDVKLNAVDWGVAVTNPPTPFPATQPRDGHTHERWLAYADKLHLNAINEVDHLDYLTAAGDTYVAEAKQVARARILAARAVTYADEPQPTTPSRGRSKA